MYTIQDLEKINITELKNILKQNNLPLYGNKEEIIKKIISIDKPINEPIDKTINEPIDKTINEPIDKTIDKPINEPINNILFLDTETSGLPETLGFNKYYDYKESLRYKNSRLIELGYTLYNNDNLINKTSFIIKPDQFVINNSYIHGITHEIALTEGITIDQVLENFYNVLKTINIIIGHNITFDLQIIKSECYRFNRNDIINEINKKDIICTMIMGKTKLKLVKYPKLIELYYHLFKINVKQNHRSLDDCDLCSKCYFKLL